MNWIDRRRPRLAPVTAGMMAMVVLLASTATAQDDAFRRGIAARDNEQWPVVVTQMREAIKVRPQESTTKIRTGFGRFVLTGGVEYLPHFFLGEALYRTGDCAGAVNEWSQSEQQTAVRARPEFVKIIQNGYVECEKKGVLPPAKLEPELARASQQINEVNALAAEISKRGQANLDIWRSDPAMRDMYERATAEIEVARGRFQSSRTSRTVRELADATAAADRARGILVTLDASLTTAIDNQRSAQSLIREINEAIGAAEGLNRNIEGKKVAFTPALTAAHQEGRDAIGKARERLNEGTKTLNAPVLTAARTFAQDASTRLRQVLDELTRIEKDALARAVSDALARAQESFSLLDSAVTTLDRFSAERPGVLPAGKVAEREAAQRQAVQARRRFEAARKADNVAGIADAARLASEARDKLNLLIGAFGPLTLRDRGVHPLLEEGARLFFAGEYQQVMTSLAGAEGLAADVPLRLHFHLFRAAALHELFVRSRETDQALRAQALAEVEHCKSIDSAFQPDTRAFSPRFVSFYQGVPAAPTPTAAAASPR